MPLSKISNYNNSNNHHHQSKHTMTSWQPLHHPAASEDLWQLPHHLPTIDGYSSLIPTVCENEHPSGIREVVTRPNLSHSWSSDEQDESDENPRASPLSMRKRQRETLGDTTNIIHEMRSQMRRNRGS